MTNYTSLINLSEWQLEFQQRDDHPILMADLWCRALYYQFPEEIKLDIPGLDYLFTSTRKGYVKKTQKQQILNKINEKCKSEDYLDYIFRTTQLRVKELQSFADKVDKKLAEQNITSEELAGIWKSFDKLMLKVVPWFYIPWYITEENILTDLIKSKLEQHTEQVTSITDINNALMTLIYPVRQTQLQEERRSFFELVKQAQGLDDWQNNPELLNKIEQYRNAFAWTKTFLLLPIEPLSTEEITERIQDAIKLNQYEEFLTQEKKGEENRQLAEKLLQILKEDDELISLVHWARKFGWVLSASVEQALIATVRLQPFFKLIAKRLKINWDNLIHFTSKEIFTNLELNDSLTKYNIEDRKRGYVFLIGSGYIKTFYGLEGKSFSEWLDRNINKISADIHILEGKPACPGYVIGKIYIALTPEESKGLQPNEILVCSMTSPDYLPAMQRSAAIVTNEGGLLSHAAIVSRELGKPCVIATKIATQVLKTGDLVEVDANKGLVSKVGTK